MICKVCSDVFTPETYRERITGTCDKEACWRPFNDTDDLQFVEEDLFQYKFKCLRCGVKILTNTKGERICQECKKKKRYKNTYSGT